jgi:hypothetical protein
MNLSVQLRFRLVPGYSLTKMKFTPYIAFCAIVVLYIHTIQRRFDFADNWRPDFLAAEKCQAQLTSQVDKSSLVQRYGVVLEELRQEVVKQIKKVHTGNKSDNSESATRRGGAQSLDIAVQQSDSNLPTPFISQATDIPSTSWFTVCSPEVPNIPLTATYIRPLAPADAVDAAQLPFTDICPGPSPSSMFGWAEFDSLVCGSWTTSLRVPQPH